MCRSDWGYSVYRVHVELVARERRYIPYGQLQREDKESFNWASVVAALDIAIILAFLMNDIGDTTDFFPLRRFVKICIMLLAAGA